MKTVRRAPAKGQLFSDRNASEPCRNGSFRKLGVPCFGVLTIRILLFRVRYLGSPFGNSQTGLCTLSSASPEPGSGRSELWPSFCGAILTFRGLLIVVVIVLVIVIVIVIVIAIALVIVMVIVIVIVIVQGFGLRIGD